MSGSTHRCIAGAFLIGTPGFMLCSVPLAWSSRATAFLLAAFMEREIPEDCRSGPCSSHWAGHPRVVLLTTSLAMPSMLIFDAIYRDKRVVVAE